MECMQSMWEFIPRMNEIIKIEKNCRPHLIAWSFLSHYKRIPFGSHFTYAFDTLISNETEKRSRGENISQKKYENKLTKRTEKYLQSRRRRPIV